jgi:hypothetical protein
MIIVERAIGPFAPFVVMFSKMTLELHYSPAPRAIAGFNVSKFLIFRWLQR